MIENDIYLTQLKCTRCNTTSAFISFKNTIDEMKKLEDLEVQFMCHKCYTDFQTNVSFMMRTNQMAAKFTHINSDGTRIDKKGFVDK